MADDLRHAQSAETLPLRMESPERLKDLTQATTLLFRAAWPVSKAQHPTERTETRQKGRSGRLISDRLLEGSHPRPLCRPPLRSANFQPRPRRCLNLNLLR